MDSVNFHKYDLQAAQSCVHVFDTATTASDMARAAVDLQAWSSRARASPPDGGAASRPAGPSQKWANHNGWLL